MFFLAVISLWPALGRAADITFHAMVDQTAVELGAGFQLTLTVDGTQSVDPIEIPEMDGLKARYLGPSTRVSIINGQFSGSVAFLYNVYPVKLGQLQIPAISTVIDGETYTTQPIDIQVVDQGELSAQTQDQAVPNISLQDKIFVIMGLPKAEFYINEEIPITIQLFVNGLSIRDIHYPEFEHVGFSVEEYQPPKRYKQIVGGIKYDIIEFKTKADPIRMGGLTLGPTKLNCNIVFQMARNRSRRGGFDSIFDDDFFNDFLGRYETRSVTLESDPLDIQVLPLPKEGRPENFTGAVGKFKFNVTVSPVEVKVGDPITVRMSISGDGNLKSIEMLSFEKLWKDKKSFKYYKPQINEENGVKTIEQVVVPRTDKIKEIPEISFNYFDIGKKQYKTVTHGPFALTVQKLEEGDALKVVGLGQSEELKLLQDEHLGQDIRFIKERPGRWYTSGRHLYNNFIFLFIVFLSVVVWGVFAGVYSVTHRIKTDEKFARRLQAPRQAKRGLHQARSFIQKGNQKDFYDCLFKTLQQYFSNKFHMPVGSITVDAVRNILRTKGLGDEVAEKIRDVFGQCEMVRYASAQLDKVKMDENYKSAAEIIDYFERNL